MARPAVRVEGLRELQSALRKVNRDVANDLRDELKEAAKPVADSASVRLTRFQGASTVVRVHVLGRGVYVRQAARKTTGLRPDFGGVQMRSAFLPALAENEDTIVHQVEQALDRFADRAGF